jgi:hypothetical protein
MHEEFPCHGGREAVSREEENSYREQYKGTCVPVLIQDYQPFQSTCQQYSGSATFFLTMKFLLALTYGLVATVSAAPSTQETCQEAANNCSGWFNSGCND